VFTSGARGHGRAGRVRSTDDDASPITFGVVRRPFRAAGGRVSDRHDRIAASLDLLDGATTDRQLSRADEPLMTLESIAQSSKSAGKRGGHGTLASRIEQTTNGTRATS